MQSLLLNSTAHRVVNELKVNDELKVREVKEETDINLETDYDEIVDEVNNLNGRQLFLAANEYGYSGEVENKGEAKIFLVEAMVLERYSFLEHRQLCNKVLVLSKNQDVLNEMKVYKPKKLKCNELHKTTKKRCKNNAIKGTKKCEKHKTNTDTESDDEKESDEKAVGSSEKNGENNEPEQVFLNHLEEHIFSKTKGERIIASLKEAMNIRVNNIHETTFSRFRGRTIIKTNMNNMIGIIHQPFNGQACPDFLIVQVKNKIARICGFESKSTKGDKSMWNSGIPLPYNNIFYIHVNTSKAKSIAIMGSSLMTRYNYDAIIDLDRINKDAVSKLEGLAFDRTYRGVTNQKFPYDYTKADEYQSKIKELFC